MNVASFLTKAARTFAERPAVSLGTEPCLTYGALGSRVAQLAGTLTHRCGLQPGDRVALAMSNGPEYVEILYAVWHAGLTAGPMNARLHQREFAYILDNSGARLCFATPDLVETVAPLTQEVASLEAVIATGDADYQAFCTGQGMRMRDVAPDAIAWLFYTSGTTGRPKGAMLTHQNLLVMTLSYFADIDTTTPYDCMIHAAPMSHGSGLYGLPHVAKAAHQVIPVSGGFDLGELVELIAAYQGVTCFFAPTMVTRLVNHPTAPSVDTHHREIEEVLLRHPGVLEVSVVGRPHRDWGEEVVVFVVPRPEAAVTAEALDRLCLDTMARYKRPRAYVFVDSLPKNNYGKVLKTTLRQQLAAAGPQTGRGLHT